MAAGEGTRLQLWPLSLLYQAEAGGGGVGGVTRLRTPWIWDSGRKAGEK